MLHFSCVLDLGGFLNVLQAHGRGDTQLHQEVNGDVLLRNVHVRSRLEMCKRAAHKTALVVDVERRVPAAGA